MSFNEHEISRLTLGTFSYVCLNEWIEELTFLKLFLIQIDAPLHVSLQRILQYSIGLTVIGTNGMVNKDGTRWSGIDRTGWLGIISGALHNRCNLGIFTFRRVFCDTLGVFAILHGLWRLLMAVLRFYLF